MGLKLWDHVHIVNPNWHEAAQWYAKYSPLDCPSWEHPGHKGYKSEVLRSGPNKLLMQSTNHADVPQTAAIESVGLAVPDLDASLESFTAGGGNVESENDASTKVTDPWGMRLELLQSDEGDSAISHVNIVAQDPEMLSDWYQQHLGGEFRTCEFDESRTALVYDTCQLLFSQRDVVAPDESAGYRHYDHLGWLVEDIHGTCDDLVAGGVEFPNEDARGFANPPKPGDGRIIAFGCDPCGIWFELVNLRPDRIHFTKIGRWDGGWRNATGIGSQAAKQK